MDTVYTVEWTPANVNISWKPGDFSPIIVARYPTKAWCPSAAEKESRSGVSSEWSWHCWLVSGFPPGVFWRILRRCCDQVILQGLVGMVISVKDGLMRMLDDDDDDDDGDSDIDDWWFMIDAR